MQKGFTLLELLIVVIIIGILAGLAVPNFFRAVERARWAEAKQILGPLRGSQMRYKAERGIYTNIIGNLDIEITTPKYFNPGVQNSINCIAYCYRNSNQDTYGLNGQYICIGENGTFIYRSGVPGWLR